MKTFLATSNREYDPRHLAELRKQVEGMIQQATGSKDVILAHTILVDFFEGDHNAAIFLNQVMYWTARTANTDGWFYKTHHNWYDELRFSAYQVRRVIFGDDRVMKFRRTLWSLGLETMVRMAPNGRNATFYRLNLSAFMTTFVEWLEARFGYNAISSGPHESNETATVDERPAIDTPQNTWAAYKAYEPHFGHLRHHVKKQLRDLRSQLGDTQAHEVIRRCVGRGHSWNYVLAALQNETEARAAQPTPAPSSPAEASGKNDLYDIERLNEEAERILEERALAAPVTANVTDEIKQGWRNITREFTNHMGFMQYHLHFGESTLVDCRSDANGIDYVLAMPDERRRDAFVGNFLERLLLLAKSVAGQPVNLHFITEQDWRTQLQRE